MKLNGLSVLFLLAALGMGGWAVWEQRKGAALEEKLASVSQERDVLRMTANKKLALGSKTEVKQDGPEGLGPDHAKALEEEIKSKEKPAAADENPMAAVAKMMKDPAMREMMKTQMRSQVDFMYRDLFDLLGLDAGKQEQLTKLLVERAGAGMDLGFSMMGGEKISDEERKKKTEAMAAATAESDKALKELLGDDYAKYDSFEKSQPERQQLNTLNGLLKDKGIALSEEAESKLMDTMFKERTNFKYDVDLSDQKTMDPGKFTAENLSRFQEQQAVLRGQILIQGGADSDTGPAGGFPQKPGATGGDGEDGHGNGAEDDGREKAGMTGRRSGEFPGSGSKNPSRRTLMRYIRPLAGVFELSPILFPCGFPLFC